MNRTEVQRGAFTHSRYQPSTRVDNGKVYWSDNNNGRTDCLLASITQHFCLFPLLFICFLYGLLLLLSSSSPFFLLPNAAAFIIVFVAYNISASILVLFSTLMCCVHVYLAIAVRGEHTHIQNCRALALTVYNFCFCLCRRLNRVHFLPLALVAAAAVIVVVTV